MRAGRTRTRGVLASILAAVGVAACGAPAAPIPGAPAPPPPPPQPTAPAAPPADAGAVEATADAAASEPNAPMPCPSTDLQPSAIAQFDPSALPRRGAVEGVEGGGIARVSVFRGVIYQRGKVAIGAHTALRVPVTALVSEGARDGTIEVYVSKSLGFMGHPPEPMRGTSVRRNQGVATRDDGGTLVLATYGEFGTIEGGASMDVLVRVPKGFPVHARHGLAGDGSVAGQWPNDEAGYRASQVGRIGYWYAAVNPVKGWKPVALVDDPQRVTAEPGKYPDPPTCEP
jgi:hypothetical protein